MVDQSEYPKSASKAAKIKARPEVTAEEIWVRDFLEFSGTDNVTGFCVEDLHAVSLTRVVEALTRGELSWSEKCDGPGTRCGFTHTSDNGETVVVTVWFEASAAKLDIETAKRVEENDSETYAA